MGIRAVVAVLASSARSVIGVWPEIAIITISLGVALVLLPSARARAFGFAGSAIARGEVGAFSSQPTPSSTVSAATEPAETPELEVTPTVEITPEIAPTPASCDGDALASLVFSDDVELASSGPFEVTFWLDNEGGSTATDVLVGLSTVAGAEFIDRLDFEENGQYWLIEGISQGTLFDAGDIPPGASPKIVMTVTMYPWWEGDPGAEATIGVGIASAECASSIEDGLLIDLAAIELTSTPETSGTRTVVVTRTVVRQTPTPEVTESVETETPELEETPDVTLTPEIDETKTPELTKTVAVTHTVVVPPTIETETETPVPSAMPGSSETPDATRTPPPTHTPVPTSTSTGTATAVPTSTQTPEPVSTVLAAVATPEDGAATGFVLPAAGSGNDGPAASSWSVIALIVCAISLVGVAAAVGRRFG